MLKKIMMILVTVIYFIYCSSLLFIEHKKLEEFRIVLNQSKREFMAHLYILNNYLDHMTKSQNKETDKN